VKPTTLTQAAHDANHAGVIDLLAAGSDPNEIDGLGWNPLLYAVLAADLSIVDLLITAGANLDGAAPDGATPLIKAALWGHIDIVRALLDAGADPQRRDRGGWSALEIAEAGHFPDVASLLRAESLNTRIRRNAS
jgi:ankyrin repeat protein